MAALSAGRLVVNRYTSSYKITSKLKTIHTLAMDEKLAKVSRLRINENSTTGATMMTIHTLQSMCTPNAVANTWWGGVRVKLQSNAVTIFLYPGNNA